MFCFLEEMLWAVSERLADVAFNILELFVKVVKENIPIFLVFFKYD